MATTLTNQPSCKKVCEEMARKRFEVERAEAEFYRNTYRPATLNQFLGLVEQYGWDLAWTIESCREANKVKYCAECPLLLGCHLLDEILAYKRRSEKEG